MLVATVDRRQIELHALVDGCEQDSGGEFDGVAAVFDDVEPRVTTAKPRHGDLHRH